ncbi:MFS transporter [Desulfovibrio sp. OttesenSCG-928-I05]|nr:MFS transporter [Desulfovibrio sp. OttesenSCG-928-I05]
MSILRSPHALLAFGMTTCMIMGNNSIVPVVPLMRDIFGISPASASLAITAFTLPGIVFSPLSGLLADRYGRKPVALVSLALFCLGGVLCALAPNFPMLLACRFLQGVGGGALGVLNAMIIADSFPRSELSRMMGYNGTVLSLSTAMYPLIGGVLALIGWRATFALPLIALPVFFLALRTPLQGPGSSTGLGEYMRESWRISRSSRNVLLFTLTFLTFTMLYGPMVTSLPMMGRDVFSLNPAAIGSVTIASSLGAAIMASQLGRLSRRYSSVRLMAVAQFFYIAALIIFPFMPTAWMLALPALLFGCGQGLNISSIQALLMADTPAGQRGAIMAVNGMLLRLGQTTGPILFGAIIAAFGIGTSFHAGAILACIMLGLVVFRLNRITAPSGDGDTPPSRKED